MSTPKKLRSYEYVNRPYEQVHAMLRDAAPDLLQRATNRAAGRADALISKLHVGVGLFEVGVDVRIHVIKVDREEQYPGLSPITRVTLRWEASRGAGLFPKMKASLNAWPIGNEETQLEVDGEYTPPLGVVGSALDALAGHRIAEAAVKHFLDEIVEQLRRDLPVVDRLYG